MYLNKLRSKTGVIILILLTLLPNIYNSFRMIKAFPAYLKVDSVTINELRLIALKKYLPEASEVGYITDMNNKDIFSSTEAVLKDAKATNKAIDVMAQLILTQYTLAPVFVYNQTNLPLVVGNFPNGLPDKKFFIKKHLTPVKVFPQGIILLRNEAVK